MIQKMPMSSGGGSNVLKATVTFPDNTNITINCPFTPTKIIAWCDADTDNKYMSVKDTTNNIDYAIVYSSGSTYPSWNVSSFTISGKDIIFAIPNTPFIGKAIHFVACDDSGIISI